MLGDLMEKLQEARKMMEESKKELDGITVDAEVEGGAVKVVANGNRVIKNISISENLIKKGDKEAIEDLVLVAVNKALENAVKLGKEKIKDAAKGVLPKIPGLF